MKKNIGNSLALYPTPLVVVGAMVNGKPNWLLVGHLGIIGHDHVMVSLLRLIIPIRESGKAESSPSTSWMRQCLPKRTTPAASAAIRRTNPNCLTTYWMTPACR